MAGRIRRVQQRDAGSYYREMQQRDAGSYYREMQRYVQEVTTERCVA